MLERLRRVRQQFLAVDFLPDNCVRTDHHTLAALNAQVRLPDRNLERQVALLPLSRPGRKRAVNRQRANGDLVPLEDDHRTEYLLDEVRRLIRDRRPARQLRGDLPRDLDLEQVLDGRVHRIEILLDDGLAALAVSLLDGVFDLGDGLLARQDAADGEEGGLHDGVDASAHAGLLGDIVTVDDVELELLLDDLSLNFGGQVIPDFIRAIKAVQQENAAGPGVLQHIELLEEIELMASHKIGLIGFDQVWRTDRLRPEAQMGGRHRARFLRVVDEVALREIVGLFADDLDRVLVGTDRAVRAEAEEHATHRLGRLDREGGIHLEAGVRDIVNNADREVVLRLSRRVIPLRGTLTRPYVQFIQRRLEHGRRELFGRQAVASTDDFYVGSFAFDQRIDHIQIKRLASRAGFLGAIQDGDGLDCPGQSRNEMRNRKWPVESDAHHADLLALLHQVFHCLLGSLAARTHDDDHAFGFGMPGIVEEMVLALGDLGELVHHLLCDGGRGGVERVDRLARLEVDIRILRGAAQHGMLRGECARPVGADQLIVHERAEFFIRELVYFCDLVGGPESVEEMQERHAGFEGGHLRDGSEIVRLLDRAG